MRSGRAGSLGDEAADDEVEIDRLAGVVEAERAIGLVAAGAKDEKIGGPAAPLRLVQQSARVVRADRSLEPVQDEKSRRTGAERRAGAGRGSHRPASPIAPCAWAARTGGA